MQIVSDLFAQNSMIAFNLQIIIQCDHVTQGLPPSPTDFLIINLLLQNYSEINVFSSGSL